MTIAYLYKWIHVPTQKWYIGSRTAVGCHPGDGYVCSSKTVEPMILENRADWDRQILCLGNPKYILELECNYLKLLDAKNDPMSFNLHNGDGKFSTAGTLLSESHKSKLKLAKVGKCVGSDNGFFGRRHKPESLEKIKRIGPDNGLFGKSGIAHPKFGTKLSEQTKLQMSISKKGDNHPSKKIENQLTCQHCGLTTQKANHTRWHGDNCKQRKNNVSS